MPKNKLRLIPEPEYTRRKKAGKCVVAFCTNSSGNKGKFRFCYKHFRENQKYENPLRYWFDVLRQNARYRKKEFNLTIDEFRIFCEKTDYLQLKGRGGGNITIDRKDNRKGYSFDNIQVLTLSQNSRKRWIDMKLQFGYYPTNEELIELYGGELPDYSEPINPSENFEDEEFPF